MAGRTSRNTIYFSFSETNGREDRLPLETQVRLIFSSVPSAPLLTASINKGRRGKCEAGRLSSESLRVVLRFPLEARLSERACARLCRRNACMHVNVCTYTYANTCRRRLSRMRGRELIRSGVELSARLSCKTFASASAIYRELRDANKIFLSRRIKKFRGSSCK